MREPARLVSAPRPDSFSVDEMPPRVDWKAGTMPKSSPVSSDTPIVNAITTGSTRTSARRGIPCGSSATRASTPHTANSNPSAPPTTPRMTLSVSNCRTSRERPAPRAVRTAISLSRAAARASNRFATFTHAISSTKPTAPSRSQNALRISPTIASCRATAVMPTPSLLSGYCVASWRPMVSISTCACLADTPVFIRPTAVRYQAPRCFESRSSEYSSGTHTDRAAGNENPSGITPTISCATPSSVIRLPTMARSPPKRRSQRS